MRRDALAIWKAGVAAVDAGKLVEKSVRVSGNRLRVGDGRFPLGDLDRIVVVGAGKGGAAMARALERALGRTVLEAKQVEGLINVPADQVVPLKRIVLHPGRSSRENLPTRDGVRGSRKMLRMVRDLSPRDLVICLISGGGSALLPAPVEGITLAHKQRVTRLLMASGATINEMNAVRKHLSRLKGGGLARTTRARVVSLIVSDVVGDPLDVIASGPTSPDPTTYADALEVLERYELMQRAPRKVVEHLFRGARGEVPETWKRGAARVQNCVIGNNDTALRKAATEARKRSYKVVALSSYLEGESRELGVFLAGLARGVREQQLPQAPPVCILSGGETTVALGAAAGKGGRNQEIVLAALAHLSECGLAGITLLSGGTDGEDGPTDAAGAVADDSVLRKARDLGLDPEHFLDRHDAYPFFEKCGGLVKTGPTRTNVMDLRVTLIRKPGSRKR